MSECNGAGDVVSKVLRLNIKTAQQTHVELFLRDRFILKKAPRKLTLPVQGPCISGPLNLPPSIFSDSCMQSLTAIRALLNRQLIVRSDRDGPQGFMQTGHDH